MVVFGGKEHAWLCRRHRRPGFHPWVGKTLWRREWRPSPVFLPGESHGQRSLVGYSLWGLERVRHDLATKQQYALGLSILYSVPVAFGASLNWPEMVAKERLDTESYLGKHERLGGSSCRELTVDSRKMDPMDRGAWRAAVHRVPKESDTTEWLHVMGDGSCFQSCVPVPLCWKFWLLQAPSLSENIPGLQGIAYPQVCASCQGEDLDPWLAARGP